MASLVLLASLIILSLIVIGPITYILCSLSCIPDIFRYLMGIACASIGLWAIFIPVPLCRILGLVNFSIGLKVLLASKNKKTQA